MMNHIERPYIPGLCKGILFGNSLYVWIMSIAIISGQYHTHNCVVCVTFMRHLSAQL